MIVSATLLILAAWTLVALAANYQPRAGTSFPHCEGRCRSCGYSLDGLPRARPCPECGRDRPHEGVRVDLPGAVPRWALHRIAGLWLIAAAGLAAFLWLVHVAHGWSYTLQLGRYDPDVIARARRLRLFDLDWGNAFIPFGAALTLCSLMLLRGKAANFREHATRVALTGWTLTIAWLFLETYIRYS